MIVALQPDDADHFAWPVQTAFPPPTVGDTLVDLMAENGWQQAEQWAARAQAVAPTIVGGSKKSMEGLILVPLGLARLGLN